MTELSPMSPPSNSWELPFHSSKTRKSKNWDSDSSYGSECEFRFKDFEEEQFPAEPPIVDLEPSQECTEKTTNIDTTSVTFYLLADGVRGFEQAEVGREIHLVFETTDAERKRYYKEDDQIMVKIQVPTRIFVKKKIEDSADGTYTVSFTPDTEGPHSVLITVNGLPLTGSPWSVQVYPQYKHVFTFGPFIRPEGISINWNTDHIAVTYANNNRVQIFNADGCYLAHFHQDEIIRSLAFSKNGDLIVVQEFFKRGARISLLSESGQFIRDITNKHVKQAHCLSVAPDGNIIVYDLGDENIKVLSPDGAKLLQSFSADIPEDIAYHQELFFASVSRKHAVSVYNKEGVFLYDIDGGRQLERPGGLAIDKFNNLIVCDLGKMALQVFTLDGKFVNTIGKLDTKLLYPHDITVSKAGLVYVTDFLNNCVHVFQGR